MASNQDLIATCSNDPTDKVLLQPYEYILKCSGKQIRSKLIQSFNFWLQVPNDKILIISQIVEMLHNSSLLIDDIEDNSILRRGIPVAHNIFGVASTINSANYVYFLSLEKVIKELPSDAVPKAVDIFCQQLLELHRGQGMDIYWRDSFQCPTEEEYLEMIGKKTGGLFGLGVRLLQLFSHDLKDYQKLIKLLGSYFQIRDDYANLKSKEVSIDGHNVISDHLFQQYAENKSYCEDLTEGKFSFPVVHAIQSFPDDPTLINIIRQRPKNVEIKRFAVDLMEKHGSFDYTLECLKRIEGQTRDEVENLGGNPHLTSLLNEMDVSRLK